MRKALPLVLFLCLLMGSGLSLAQGENLLINGDFEETLEGYLAGWQEEMWRYEAGVSFLEPREGGREGAGTCAFIENSETNDARFVQTVKVTPGAIYHLSGWVKAEGCDPAYGGAGPSVLDTQPEFPSVYDTEGQWVFLETYFRTAAGQKEISVGPRIGYYGADNVGNAYFDDLSLLQTDAVPPGIEIIQLASIYPAAQAEKAAPKEAAPPSPFLWPALFLLLLPILWYLRVRGIPNPRIMVLLVLALALLLRLYLMATQAGYATDMSCFYAWGLHMAEVGPTQFYQTISFCDYPPGYMYPLWLTGALLKITGAGGLDADLTRILVKSMPVIADLLACALLYRAAKKLLSEKKALLLMALYAFSPAILINGAVWGQVDAVMALGLLGSLLLINEKKWQVALPLYTLTVLLKPQALMAGPLGVVALICHLLSKEDRKAIALHALYGFGLSLLGAAAMLLPFLINQEAPITFLIGLYGDTLSSYAHPTVNAANLFYLLGGNWADLSATVVGIPYGLLGTVLMALSVIGIMGLALWRRKDNLLPFYGALTYIALFVLGVKMHERYLFPALLLLLYAYTLRPDRRLLHLFIGFSITLFANCAIVLRDVHLPLGFGFAGCFLGAINILLLGYGIWVAVDMKLRPLPTQTFKGEKEHILPGASLLSAGDAEKQASALAPEAGDAPGTKSAKGSPLPDMEGRTPPAFALTIRDWALMLGLTLIYAAIAYIGLGSPAAPQTTYAPARAGEEIIIDLGSTQTFRMLYYGGITNQGFDLSASSDGENWSTPVPQPLKEGDCFRWQYGTEEIYDAWGSRTKMPMETTARYVKLIAGGESMRLMEVAFQDPLGNPLAATLTAPGGAVGWEADFLLDEQDTVPDAPGYFNSAYFDEIYHGRTGYEHAHGLRTYETTHPPLGKVFIMWGIKLFGMTPFGWRFMGALMGVLMIPAMYLLAKLLFKKTRYAFLGAFLMAFDMMHLTQTRIATIDSYAVLFIILMYLCMLRYLQMSFFRDGWRTLIPLGLSGLFMGLGCASKWICIYAGAGLAILFFWSLFRSYREYKNAMALGGRPAEIAGDFPRYAIGTLGACLLFFIAIPFAIYYASYIPYFTYEGGLTLGRFLDAQTGMFSYHSTLVDDHAFQSPWYEWPLSLKPMYYYDGKPYLGPGMVATIMAMGNPAVWWVGFAAMLYMIYRWLRPHYHGEIQRDHRPALLLLSFAAQFLPWVLVSRSTFIYHYFGSLPFVIMAIVFAYERLDKRYPRLGRNLLIAHMAVIVLLFIGFYPLATGMEIPRWRADMMNWLGFLKLPGWQYRGWLYY